MSNEEHGTVTTSDEPSTATCPVMSAAHQAVGITANQHWWPDSVNLRILRQNHPQADPMGEDFDYAAEFNSLDFDALANDVDALMTESQDWWPADFGHYGAFFIRMTWHAAGTYRIADGRGGGGSGAQRFAPLNSWPDNANLDKARRLLWPIKQKYGRKISWADLLVFAGNRALETMGFKTFGFGGGREDIWAPEDDVYWGPERVWLEDQRYSGDRELANPLGAVQMGLIYVNPEGPNGNPDPMASARDIRETFGRMAMNDEETVALIAGGHTFGKTHGAADPDKYVGREPEGRPSSSRDSAGRAASAPARAATRSPAGSKGIWTNDPIRWDNGFFENLFGYEWELTKSPAGAQQWTPKNPEAQGTVPDAHDPSKRHAPMMVTSDIALIVDPVYKEISKRFHENPDQFADAFARAWYKLLHRDMGPVARYLGPWVPDEELLWQDPVPAVDHELIDDADVAALKAKIARLRSVRLPARLDGVGVGVDLPRHRQARWRQRGADPPLAAGRVGRQRDLRRVAGVVDPRGHPAGVQRCPDGRQEGLAGRPDRARRRRGGRAGGEAGRPRRAGPVHAGAHRCHAGADRRRVLRGARADRRRVPQLPPEGPRPRGGAPVGRQGVHAEAVGSRDDGAPRRPARPERQRRRSPSTVSSPTGPSTLTNDFFVNLLDMGTEWKATSDTEDVFEGRDRATGELRWTGTRVDLIFGSSSELRALAEVYASDDAEQKFVVTSWRRGTRS